MSEESNTAIPTGKSKSAVAAREAEGVRLFLAGKDFTAIGRALGYSGTDEAVRGTAYTAVMRALKRQLATDAEVVRDREDARIDAMIEALWPVATGDLSLVRAFLDAAGLIPMRDDSKREIVYVVPPLEMLKAIDQCMKLGKRQADIHGTDFQHKLDQRKADIEEQQVNILGAIVTAVVEAMQPSLEQAERGKAEFTKQIALVRGQTAESA